MCVRAAKQAVAVLIKRGREYSNSEGATELEACLATEENAWSRTLTTSRHMQGLRDGIDSGRQCL